MRLQAEGAPSARDRSLRAAMKNLRVDNGKRKHREGRALEILKAIPPHFTMEKPRHRDDGNQFSEGHTVV